MAAKDLGYFLDLLRKSGELLSVPEAVDLRFEVSEFLRQFDESGGPAFFLNRLSFDDRGFVYLRELAERVQDRFPDVREEELLEVLRTRTKNALSCGKERSGQLMAIPSQWILRTKW